MAKGTSALPAWYAPEARKWFSVCPIACVSISLLERETVCYVLFYGRVLLLVTSTKLQHMLVRGGTWWYVVVRGGTWWYVVVEQRQWIVLRVALHKSYPSLCSLRLQAGKTQHVLGTQRVQHFELKKKKTQGTFCLTFSSHYNK